MSMEGKFSTTMDGFWGTIGTIPWDNPATNTPDQNNTNGFGNVSPLSHDNFPAASPSAPGRSRSQSMKTVLTEHRFK